MELLEITKKLFEKFKIAEIRYCQFKSNEHLGAGLAGETDLDILVCPEDKRKCDEILSQLGFKNFEPVKIGRYHGVVNWYGFDKATGKLIHLHLHFQLVTGKMLIKEYVLPWSEIIIKTAIEEKDTGVKISNPNVEYILLSTRLILKRRIKEDLKSIGRLIFISNDIKKELNYLKSQVDKEELKNYIIQMFSKKNSGQIFEMVYNIDKLTFKKYKKLEKIIREELASNRRMNGICASLLSFKNRAVRSIFRKCNQYIGSMLPVKKRSITRGLSIAFVGIDGSGKSTLSTEIYKWLGAEFDTIKFYAGSGDGKKNFIVSMMLKGYSLIRKRNNTKISKVTNENKDDEKSFSHNNFVNKIKNALGAFVYYKILKDNLNKIEKANKYCSQGCFCIMDRYPQSKIVSDHDGPKVSKYLNKKQFFFVEILGQKEKKLFQKFDNSFLKFDIVFRLNVSPDIAIKRKPDHDYDSMLRRAESLKTVPFNSKRIIDIDADENLDAIILKIKEIIWGTI